MKKCGRCKILKPLEDFAKNRSAKDALQKRCKKCSQEYDKIRYSAYWKDQIIERNKQYVEDRRILIWNYLLQHPCVDCGETDPIVLQFDHIKGEKLFSISSGYNRYAWKNVLLEIEKCEIRCANCHLKRTANQFGWYKNQRSYSPIVQTG